MFLDRNGKAINEANITNEYAWNFSGRPLDGILAQRRRLWKLESKAAKREENKTKRRARSQAKE